MIISVTPGDKMLRLAAVCVDDAHFYIKEASSLLVPLPALLTAQQLFGWTLAVGNAKVNIYIGRRQGL